MGSQKIPVLQFPSQHSRKRRWFLYFKKFGCQLCGTKKARHVGDGLCLFCRNILRSRLAVLRRP